MGVASAALQQASVPSTVPTFTAINAAPRPAPVPQGPGEMSFSRFVSRLGLLGRG